VNCSIAISDPLALPLAKGPALGTERVKNGRLRRGDPAHYPCAAGPRDAQRPLWPRDWTDLAGTPCANASGVAYSLQLAAAHGSFGTTGIVWSMR